MPTSPLPASETIDIAGHTIEYLRVGRDLPCVVLVNGSGGPLAGWSRMLPALENGAMVVAYNRTGIGKSRERASDEKGADKPGRHSRRRKLGQPQTGLHMVDQLRKLLGALEIPPPYVLVGHSLGGLVVNLFARHRPDEVSAVVLLEATAPEDVAVMAAHENGLQRLLRRTLDWLLPPDPNGETAQIAVTLAQLQVAPAFPPVPLTVVSGGSPAMAWATPTEALRARADHQLELVRLSPLGRQVIAARSGHFPQLTEPGLVADVIRQSVQAARSAPGKQAAGTAGRVIR